MKIERAWLRIIVSVVVGVALYLGGSVVAFSAESGPLRFAVLGIFTVLAGPAAAAVLVYVLTPKERLDGHTRCGKCGYILKGLTEPRCSECGERI